MLRFLAGFLFITFSFASVHVRAQEGGVYRRSVSFEWEPIEGAKYYEIEIKKKQKDAKVSTFKAQTAEWSGKLNIGHYEFRLRALDQRKVPGDWSGYSDLDVPLAPVQAKFPGPSASIKAVDADKQEVNFEWEATPGASGYSVEIVNSKGETVVADKVSSPKFSYTLAAANDYTWKVKAFSANGLESESIQSQKFTLVGPKLAKANIEKPDNEFVREVKWASVDKAESYDVVVGRYNPQLKKWQKFKEFPDYKETSLNFESDWPGGQYKVIVKSKAASRDISDVSVLNFPVREGNRSPATEYVQTMRKSIDRVDGWFAQTSWYASSISLRSNYRNAAEFSTNAITGTGRVGVGLLKSDSPWGFLFIFDGAGYQFENKIYNYFGTEISALRRQSFGDRGEIRYLFGEFSREFPAIYTSSSSASVHRNDMQNTDRFYSKAGVLGAHTGIEYWYSMTPKIGFQTNAHLYLPVTGTQIPNGGKYSGGDINYSLGVLGSYRYSSRLTGLMGASIRQESFTYTDNADQAGWSSAAFAGSAITNKVKTTISGIYINLMAEYSF
jgi:hypothetical protein